MAAIELRDIHKRFRIPHEKHTTLTERLLAAFRPVTYERFEALRGVDLDIEKGSAVGIIGGNGSGKSTLLKIMSGLLPPDRGTVSVDGSLSALLELGLGFSAELTVRENVELYAAVLGYPRREVHRRVDEAIDFAGLERFRDAKLKNLSTGMKARLGFATALQAESDILLLDEILAVGDADFQIKCLRVFEDLKRRRRTMVLVTHDLRQVQRFCDEAVWLQAGRVAAAGDPDEVIRAYVATVGAASEPVGSGPLRLVEGQMRVQRGWIENQAGRQVGRLRSGDAGALVLLVEALADIERPIIGFALRAEDRSLVYADSTQTLGVHTGMVRAGSVLEVRAEFVAALRSGRYDVQVGVSDAEETRFLDLVDTVASVVVHGTLGPQAAPELGGRISYADLQGRMTCRSAPATAGESDARPAAAADTKGDPR